MESSQAEHNRVLIKLSGEALAGTQKYGLDYSKLDYFTDEVISVCRKGYKVVLIIGGGNILRGVSANTSVIDRVSADHMGMVATLVNSLGFTSALKNKNCKAELFSSLAIEKVALTYSKNAVDKSLEENDVAIVACGTGIPFFSTDTSSVLRALELNCSSLIKATQVDGVYSKDPKVFIDAEKYDKITHEFVLENKLKVMDTSAILLAKDHNLKIKVCNVHNAGTLAQVVDNKGLHTLIAS